MIVNTLGKSHLIKTIILLMVSIFLICPFVSAQDSSIVGEVIDTSTGEPISGANIQVLLSDTETLVGEATSDSDGYYQITGLSDGNYTVTVTAMGFISQSHEVKIESDPYGYEVTILLDITLNPTLGGDGGGQDVEAEDTSFLLLIQMFLIVIIALILSLIMYSKIKKENLLKNAQRKRILEFITDNPGIHYRAILDDLELPMGVLSYHLNRLEKGQYIKSRQDGMYRRFFIKSTRTEMRFFLSGIQESILSVIKENQGISQSKIARKINVSRKVVNYHVNILDQAGLIYMESRGRESACFINNPKSAVMGEGN